MSSSSGRGSPELLVGASGGSKSSSQRENENVAAVGTSSTADHNNRRRHQRVLTLRKTTSKHYASNGPPAEYNISIPAHPSDMDSIPCTLEPLEELDAGGHVPAADGESVATNTANKNVNSAGIHTQVDESVATSGAITAKKNVKSAGIHVPVDQGVATSGTTAANKNVTNAGTTANKNVHKEAKLLHSIMKRDTSSILDRPAYPLHLPDFYHEVEALRSKSLWNNKQYKEEGHAFHPSSSAKNWLTDSLRKEIEKHFPCDGDIIDDNKQSRLIYSLSKHAEALFPKGRRFASFAQLVQAANYFAMPWCFNTSHSNDAIICSFGDYGSSSKGKRKSADPSIPEKPCIKCPFQIKFKIGADCGYHPGHRKNLTMKVLFSCIITDANFQHNCPCTPDAQREIMKKSGKLFQLPDIVNYLRDNPTTTDEKLRELVKEHGASAQQWDKKHLNRFRARATQFTKKIQYPTMEDEDKKSEAVVVFEDTTGGVRCPHPGCRNVKFGNLMNKWDSNVITCFNHRNPFHFCMHCNTEWINFRSTCPCPEHLRTITGDKILAVEAQSKRRNRKRGR